MVFYSCESILNTCVGGLIAALGALTWTIKQEFKLKQIEKELNSRIDTNNNGNSL